MTDDASSDGKWLTYQQLAEVRRISKPSAIRLVMRRHWRRQQDNERVVRVLVPHDMLEPDRAPYDASDDQSDDASYDTPSIAAGALAALEAAVGALRDQLDAANARTDAERARADRAEQGRDGERQRADDLRAQIDVLNAEMVVVRAEADRVSAQERARSDALGEQVDELHAGQELMMDAHARALAEAQDQLERVREAAAHLRQADVERRARGLLARLRTAWRGE